MGKTNGEGRSSSEKSGHLITPYEIRKKQEEDRRKEEAEWESRSGPVTIRKKGS